MTQTLPRMHFGLEVRDLDRARTFYETLLQTPPSKQRPGYVKFEPEAPWVNLSLTENPEARAAAVAGAAHFGVEVGSETIVHEAKKRLEAAGYSVVVEDAVTCCYAVQDKIWASDPDGNRWEVFVMKADAERFAESDRKAARTCCSPECCT